MALNGRWDSDPEGYNAFRESWLTRRRDLFVLEYLKSVEAGRLVLEIGSGTGSSLIDLAIARPDLNFIGIEPIAKYVAFAEDLQRQKGIQNISFQQGFAESLALDSKASCIISTDVIHHLADLSVAAASIRKCVEDNARWLAIEPSWLNPYNFQYQARTQGERNFWPRSCLRILQANGWQKKSSRYFTVIPSFVKSPSNWMKALERIIEGIPVIGGRIALELIRIHGKQHLDVNDNVNRSNRAGSSFQ